MTLCHEVGHLLGIRHCVFALCLMNGSNHLGEGERRPLQLCPLDTKKWRMALSGAKLEGGSLDLVEREHAMLAAFEQSGMAPDAELSRQRLSMLTGKG
jgi:archaemetzincin